MSLIKKLHNSGMSYLFAGSTAAFIAFFLNRWMVNIIGEKAIVSTVPFVEEMLKTGLALAVGTSILYTHAVFGIIEALYDATTSTYRGGSAAIVSLFSHMLFGMIAHLVYAASGAFLVAVFTTVVFHVAWNTWIVEVVSAKMRK